MSCESVKQEEEGRRYYRNTFGVRRRHPRIRGYIIKYDRSSVYTVLVLLQVLNCQEFVRTHEVKYRTSNVGNHIIIRGLYQQEKKNLKEND